MTIKKMLLSIALLFSLYGCEQKAQPIENVPDEQEQEHSHQKGHIQTH